ncbi:MAG: hypothetical protein J6A59_07645, partial [Lachnospiraceae bacterium]|nr:hypothetical protein [Lachnospiraceae bacterium]
MRGKLYDAYMAYSDKLKYKLGDAISYVMLEEFKDTQVTTKEKKYLLWQAVWEMLLWASTLMNYLICLMLKRL